MKELHLRRIEAAIDIWSRVLRGEFESREQLVEYLEKLYQVNDIEPIRGKTKINIYDKELATVYLVGKYGLGLDDSEIAGYLNLFPVEYKAEKVIEQVLKGEPPRSVIEKEYGEVDENTVFRVLRLAMTAVLLGFMSEQEFIDLVEKFEEEFEEYRRKIQGFKRFYIAFRLAEEIAAGNIKNRIEKEAFKHALCLRLKAEKVAPPDWLVREIAIKVLGAPEYKVNDALRVSGIEAKLR